MATNNNWNNQIAAANSVITLNSGTNTISASTDATATTVNIATAAAAKTLTVGSTNTSSSTDIQYGTGDFSLASASGDVLTATDTGEILKPLQPAYLVQVNTDILNVTGDGTTYTVVWDNEVFDQGADFSSTAFTAPVTGRYLLSTRVLPIFASAGYTTYYVSISTSNREYRSNWAVSGFNQRYHFVSVLADMDASDTATVIMQYSGGSKIVDIQGNSGAGSVVTYFSGALLC